MSDETNTLPDSAEPDFLERLRHPPAVEIKFARTARDMQLVHDILTGYRDGKVLISVVAGSPVRVMLPATTRQEMEIALLPICWLLGHADGAGFWDWIKGLHKLALESGYAIFHDPAADPEYSDLLRELVEMDRSMFPDLYKKGDQDGEPTGAAQVSTLPDDAV